MQNLSIAQLKKKKKEIQMFARYFKPSDLQYYIRDWCNI